MPRLGFLSIFGGRTMGEGDSSGDGNGVCGGQQSEESPLSQGSSCKTPAKWRYSGHWSPPQPRPLTPRERTNSEELPRSMVNSCSWDESEPPSPAATLPPIPPLTLQASPCLGSRPVTDGELESSAVPLGERRRRRGVLKEAVTKILEDKKANRQARRRGCGQSGGGLPPPHPRRASRTATPESDDDSADFAAYLLQRRSWRGRRHRSTSSDAESESITTSQGDDNSPRASPSPRPGLARRASNFLLKSFRAVSMTMRLNKKFVPTYYLSGDHELPEPEQLLDKFGHSLDSRLEEKRSSHHEQRSLCVVWDLIPEDGSTPATARHHCPVDPASLDSSRESSRNASSTDLSHDESRACDTPTGSSPAWCCESSADEHIYEEPQPNGAAPTDDPTSDGSEALEPKNLLTWPRLREGRGSFPASTLLTLPEDMSAGGIKGSLGQGRQDSPYPRRCRGFRSLPCSPLVPATLPRPPRQQVPTLHLTPNTPMSPLAAQPPQTLPPRPVLSQRPPLPPLPPRGHPPHSVRGRLAQRESAPPYAQPQHGRSSNAQYSEYETENVRNIAFRRNGPQHSPLFISVPRNSSKVQFEMEEGGSHGSGRESPIYAQPYASSPGPCHTPSYTTPFKNVYSFTPTFQSPAEAIALPSPARDSNTPTQQNVFFGQDFEVEQHLGGRSPSLATQGRDCHRDSAYFSTDESTELGGGQEDAPRGPSPPFSSALLRQAIEHSLADSLHRLPEMVASEVTRQVRECLRSSTSEVAAELHKLSCSNNGSQQLAPKRPSTLDLLGSPRRRHMFSFSCEDLLGDDPFPEGLSLSRRSSRVGGTMSVADLDMCGDNQLCSMGVAGHWDHTTSVPTHLHHLHLEQGVAQVEVEGDVVELPYKHHQPLKEALTPLCRELSQSLLLEREGEGGVTGKSVVLRLKVNVDQLDGDDYSDTSMEWDYFDQRDGGGGDGRDNSGGSGGSAPSAANGHASNQMGQQQQQQQQQPQKDRQPNPTTTKKSPAQKGQVSFALLTTEITRDEGPTGASQALGPPPPPPAPPQPGMEESSGVGPVLSSPTLPPHPSAGPCGANTDAYWLTQGDNLQPSKQQRASMAGPNDLFFGEGDDKSSGLSHKDREERLRQLRDRQQMEKQQKLEELKEHAAAAQRFREQQENERRRRLEEMRMRDADRRSQVEERKKIIQQAEQDRREAVIRKTAEREQRMETKRRNERSNIVFAFGSSTPRMLDPKDNSSSSYWTARRATSTTNVHMVDGALARRASECGDMDLSRKRATSAHGLDRKPEDLRMSSSMYEVFHWDKSSSSHPHHPPTTQGEDLMTRSMTAAIPATAARRRTDLMPAMPSLRDTGIRSSPRHRSPVSVGSASSVTKPTRAKSAGSDRSTPSTPARTPVKPATPKKTPAQVKAESAAKKAIEKSKSTPKAKVTPKTTPLQSPSVESKPVVAAKSKKSTSRESSTVENKSETPQVVTEAATVEEKPSTEGEQKAEEKSEPKTEAEITPASDSSTPAETQKPEEATVPTTEPTLAPSQEASEKMEVVNEIVADKDDPTPQVANVEEKSSNDAPESKVDEGEKQDEAEKNLAQKAADKPVTGYATEEEYKAALAEKRRLAREAKEREQELERQRQLEEEEKERKEEEEYLRLMEEQRKAEEDRLRKAIEEADRQREEEAKRKEEEEKQREENERIEQQKRVEAEVRLKKEEEERQARKSRVAAIMARTRGKGGSNTPTKNEAKTPSEEGKNFGDGLMSTSMTDSMIGSIIAAAESQSESAAPSNDQQQEASVCSPEVKAPESSQPQPPATSQTVTAIDSTVEMTQSSVVENIVSGVSSVKLEEAHVNGDSPVPMETTPTHTVDLLGTLSDVNSVNLNGVDNSTPPQTSQGRTDNLLDSLDPLSSPLSTSTTTTSTTSTTTTNITPAASNFEQIIDLGQTKLSNEDAVNSNPPSPFIAFEQNLNKKPNQENTSTVPDLLL
ncbi:uncharacterized protein LOC126992984 isoform X14 [Eriocheir sinensis]|uniref:uncharacterized protein LOC126992984 isoform X14 n=1 Tax=Eriocheir sinensis TaxID=95602 RepID=UPI0021C6BDA1|nr:uncharacterized protein LOC126992984 isoform X14 [Eriocheir sinensis]